MTRVLPAVRRLRHLARAMSSPSSSLRASFDRFMQDETIDLEFVERPPSWPSSSLTGSAYRRIAVYDSSFNPPTRAHLALASASPHDHDGILILLSTLNADTKSSQSSSTFPQRLEMISRGLLPKLTDPPAAFALIRGPIFSTKSTILRRHLPDHRFDFIVGADTFVRIFTAKYYGGVEEMKATLDRFFDEEGSRLICARRPGQGTKEDEKALLTREEVRRYEASLTVVDVDGAEGISSTKVRDAVQTGDEPTLERMLVPEVKAYIDEESLYR